MGGGEGGQGALRSADQRMRRPLRAAGCPGGALHALHHTKGAILLLPSDAVSLAIRHSRIMPCIVTAMPHLQTMELQKKWMTIFEARLKRSGKAIIRN